MVFIHRLLALALGGVLLTLALSARRGPGASKQAADLTLVAFAVYVAQALVGAANIWTEVADAAQIAHLAVGTMLWAVLAYLNIRLFDVPALIEAGASRRAAAPRPRGGSAMTAPATSIATVPRVELRGWRATIGAYVALTKPRIIELLLVTTLPPMIVAAGGLPGLWLMLATLVGGSLAAGGANTINCYLDRDIDAIMRRTRRRPIPSGQISPDRALAFGIALSIIAFTSFWLSVNLLTAGLAVSAILFYVFVYTLWLKRSTVENIVIGGAAGAVPPLCGWAAVTNSLDAAPLIMFAIIFLWTPPHFWALAIGYTSDYAQAGIPMLPVTRGAVEARRRSLVYAVATVAASLSLYLTGDVGEFYLVVAAGLGAAFIWLSWRQMRVATTKAAMGFFRYSITYLAVIFVAMMLDQFVRF